MTFGSKVRLKGDRPWRSPAMTCYLPSYLPYEQNAYVTAYMKKRNGYGRASNLGIRLTMLANICA